MTHGLGSVRILLILTLLVTLFAGNVTAQVATPQSVVSASTEAVVDFPNGIDFSASIDFPDDLGADRVEFYYRPTTDQTLNLAFVPTSSVVENVDGLTASVRIDLVTNYLPSGIELTYFWRVFDTNGHAIDTRPETVNWWDPRFEWTLLESEQVRLYAYAFSPEFAQTTLDAAQQTVTSLEQRFELQRSEPISIWVYNTSTDFQATQRANSRESVAGVSHAGYYVIHAVFQDGNTREIGRTITHEVSHQVLYQATRNPYAAIPLWFDEGMATHAQTEGIDGYLPLAIHAAETDTLFSLTALEATFPFLPAEAPIAYAISWCAVAYILETWGDAGIAALVRAFAAGQPTTDAIATALGISPEQLDAQLRDWLLQQSRNERDPRTDVQ
jgi:hypothetical protein